MFEIVVGIITVLASGVFGYFIAKFVNSKKSTSFEGAFESIKSTIDETLIAAKNIDEIDGLGTFLLGYVAAFRVAETITDDELKILNRFINDMVKLHLTAIEKLEKN